MTDVKTPTSKEANYQTVLTNKARAQTTLQSERQQCTPPPLHPLTPVEGGCVGEGVSSTEREIQSSVCSIDRICYQNSLSSNPLIRVTVRPIRRLTPPPLHKPPHTLSPPQPPRTPKLNNALLLHRESDNLGTFAEEIRLGIEIIAVLLFLRGMKERATDL